jgi:bifunctional DNase/RNase
MELVGVRLELPTNTPILLLRETGGSRYLPIWIGTNEATAIALALEGVEPQRPLTHDLLKVVTESLGAVVSRVVVTELTDGTFFADLVMTRNGEEVHVSSRPSEPKQAPIQVRRAFSKVRPFLEPANRFRARFTITLPFTNCGMPTPVPMTSRTFSRNLPLILSV